MEVIERLVLEVESDKEITLEDMALYMSLNGEIRNIHIVCGILSFESLVDGEWIGYEMKGEQQ